MSRGGSQPRTRRRLLVLGAIQVLVVLILAEVSVRVVAPRHRALRMMLNASTDTTDFTDVTTPRELMERTMLGFSPGSVQYGFVLNSRSFRTREYKPGAAPDRVRVAALGDSFTFASGGLPHEDQWTTLTEEALNTPTNRPVEVLRFGVPDTGPAFQLRLWQLEVARLEPDVVVLAFFVGNDFVDHQRVGGVIGGHDRGLGSRLVSTSALYRVTRNLIRVRNSGAGGPAGSPGNPDSEGVAPGEPIPSYRDDFVSSRPTFGKKKFIAIEAQRMALCLRSEKDAFDELAWRTIGVVSELVDEVEFTGARCIVMVIPDQFQVDDALVEEVLEATGHRREDYDFDRPQRELVTALKSEGAEVLDLLPVFRRAADRGPLYRPRDTHWNRHGNVVAATALSRLLEREISSSPETIFSDGVEGGSAVGWSRTEGEREATRR